MAQVKFGDIIGQVQEDRKKSLLDFLNHKSRKRSIPLLEKSRKKPKDKITQKGSPGNTRLPKAIKRSKCISTLLSNAEYDMLQLMMNSEEIKKCKLKGPFFVRKGLHLLFYEFFNNEDTFFEKFNNIQMFEELVEEHDKEFTGNSEDVKINKEIDKNKDMQE